MDRNYPTTTYSASCVPPKDVLFSSSKKLQKIDVKFPTFLGKSMGFITIKNTWNPSPLNRGDATSNIKPFDFRRSKTTLVKKPPCRINNAKNENGFDDSKPPDLVETFFLARKNPNYPDNSANAIPQSYQPRNRSCSLPRHTSNECSSRRDPVNRVATPAGPTVAEEDDDDDETEEVVQLDTNCSNCWMSTKRNCSCDDEELTICEDSQFKESHNNSMKPLEWIEIFVQLPDRCRQRIHMRYNAPFKHAIRAITARLGYRSMCDLEFKMLNTQEIVMINDSPNSLGLRNGDVITVNNV